MTLVDKFIEQNFFKLLGARQIGFLNMIEHLEKKHKENGRVKIIETGTCRIKDNWEGDGQSTRIWNWVHGEIASEIYSVDLDEEAVKLSKELCPFVEVRKENSIKFLSEFDAMKLRQLDLLYLDSYDWSPETHLDSCFHHMAELATVYSSLPSGCMIAVDDKHDYQNGKHMMIQFFFEKLGVTPYFDGYQMGWIKP